MGGNNTGCEGAPNSADGLRNSNVGRHEAGDEWVGGDVQVRRRY